MKETNLLRISLSLFLVLFLSFSAFGQSLVKGIVQDENGNPIIGANIIVDGSSTGTSSDLDGNFTIEAKKGENLIISFIGFKTKKVNINANFLKIKLSADSELMEGVVVLGYGAKARKQDLSASVGVVKNTEALAARPVNSTTGMLQGQLAGVTIQANGGDPTGTPGIIIRGQGSKNGDSVLWVVDGVPGAPITSVNDIESIVVLKDAASAAIYGAQSGAGGVVLVTTKKAKEGATSVTYDAVFGINQAANLIKGLNAEEELKMRQISYANAGLDIPDGWNPAKNPWIKTTRTDWIDEIFRTGQTQRHNIVLNSGTESSQHRLSFSMNNNEGVLKNTYKNELGIRYNGNWNINDYISINENLIFEKYDLKTKDTNDAHTGIVMSAIWMPSSANVYNPLDGTYAGTTTEDPEYIAKYGSNFADAHGDVVNPIRLLTELNKRHTVSNIWTTTGLKIHNIIPGLQFNSRFSYQLSYFNLRRFSPKTDEPGKPNDSNNLRLYNSRSTHWNTENTITYNNTFGKHTIGALLSTTADHYQSRRTEIDGKTFADEDKNLQYLANAESINGEDFLFGPDANVSFVSRISYSYDDRYFATASWRRDYAGRLPKDNNYGDFPAATAAWKISNEGFFPKSDIIGLLKLRSSWGRVGNLGSIGMNYKSPTLSSKNWGESAIYGIEQGLLYNTFYFNGRALNNALTWETSEQWNWGIDLSMFNNRLDINMDYFEKRTYNLIQEQTMNWPNTIGLDPLLINLGEIRNRGFELSASWSDKINKDFSYWVSGNFSTLKNWVSDIGVKNSDGSPSVWQDGNSSWRTIDYTIQTAQGKPLNSFYLYKTDGIFQSDEEAAAYTKDGKRIQPNAVAGDLKFVDVNGDGKLDDNDRQYMGNAMPKITYAFSFGATYKNWSLSAMLQGVGGSQAFNVSKNMILSDSEGSFNRAKDILNAWSPENTGSNIPRICKNDNNDNFSTPSDWYLESTSYLRLKNVTLTYNLTSLLNKCSHLQKRGSSASIYFSGENLFTITPYSGMDPEVGGWDAMKYPVTRVLSLGFKLTY